MEGILRFKKEITIAFLILIVAFIIRVINITIIPVFADEAIYIRWSQVMRAEQTLRFLPLTDGKQPLFMWLVIPFLKLFEDPLLAGRLVSALTGLGTIVGIFSLTFLLFRSVNTALIGGLIYAVSPFSVFFDRLALADSMLSFFGIWFVVFSVGTVKYLRLDTAMLAGFALGGAWLTKSPAIYFLILSPSFFILLDWTQNKKTFFVKALIYAALLITSILIGFGLYNILRLGPDFHMIALRNTDYVYPFKHIFSSPFDPLKPFLHRILEYFWIMGPFTLMFLLVFGVINGLRLYTKETLLLMAFALLPLFASAEFSKTMTARYVYFSVPYFLILSASAFLGKDKMLKFHNLNLKKLKAMSILRNGGFTIFLLLLFVLHSIHTDYQLLISPEKANLPRSERSGYLEEWTAGHGIKEASVYLKDEAKNLPSGNKLVVGTEGHFGTLPDGLQIYLNNVPNITVIGVGQPIRDVHISLKDSKAFGNKTYLLVNDTRFLGERGTLGLKLISKYPKAVKPDGTIESLLFFEVTD